MRRIKIFMGVLACASVFIFAQVASADISNCFTTADSEQDVVGIDNEFNTLTDDWYFGVYDWNGGSTWTDAATLDLLEGGSGIYFAEFQVVETGGTFKLHVSYGEEAGDEVDIGTNYFSFYFRNSDGSTFDINPLITDIGNDQYSFTSTQGGGSTVIDIAAVPIPGAAVLLFSGFAGLLAFARSRGSKE